MLDTVADVLANQVAHAAQTSPFTARRASLRVATPAKVRASSASRAHYFDGGLSQIVELTRQSH